MATLSKQNSLDEKTEDILQILFKILLTIKNSLLHPTLFLEEIYKNRIALKEKKSHYPYLNPYLYLLANLFAIIDLIKKYSIEDYNSIKIDTLSNIKSGSFTTFLFEDFLHLILVGSIAIAAIEVSFYYIISYKKKKNNNTDSYKNEVRAIEVIKKSSFYFVANSLVIPIIFELAIGFGEAASTLYLIYVITLIALFYLKKIGRCNSVQFYSAVPIIAAILFLYTYVPNSSKALLRASFKYWGTLDYWHKVPIFQLNGDDTLYINSIQSSSTVEIELKANIQNLYPHDIILPKKGAAFLVAKGDQIDTIKFSIIDSTYSEFLSINNGEIRAVRLTSSLDTSSFKRVKSLPYFSTQISNTGFNLKLNYLPTDPIEKDYSKKIFLKFN